MAEMIPEVPQSVYEWIERNYPKPKLDPTWIQDCYDWILSDGIIPDPPNYGSILKVFEQQLLKSDLYDSTVQGSGLPPQVDSLETSLRIAGPPVLVQITDITDVGISAFQLEQVRKAREERIRAGIRAGRVAEVEDEEGEGGDMEIEGDEGPMPKYPRGTLMLHLSDGHTTLKAMEYKPLPQLSLLSTPLGYKLQLKDVRVVLGVAYLEPRNTTLKGGNTLDNDHKELRFRQGLNLRLGLPVEPEPIPVNDNHHDPDAPGAPQIQEVPVVRSPLREISPPPLPPPQSHVNDDANLEDRRRRVPSTSSTLQPTISRTTLAHGVSPYFAGPSAEVADMDMTPLSPTLRQSAPALPKSPSFFGDDDDFGMDFDVLDEIEREATEKQNQKAGATQRSVTAKPTQQTAPPKFSNTVETNHEATESEDNYLPDSSAFKTRRRTRFPGLLASPIVRGKDPELSPALAKAIENVRHPRVLQSRESSTSDYDIDDDFDFGKLDSEDLKMIEAAEKGKKAAVAPTRQTNASKGKGKEVQRGDDSVNKGKTHKKTHSRTNSSSTTSPKKAKLQKVSASPTKRPTPHIYSRPLPRRPIASSSSSQSQRPTEVVIISDSDGEGDTTTNSVQIIEVHSIVSTPDADDDMDIVNPRAATWRDNDDVVMDEESDDKENMPVATRHVRRRVADREEVGVIGRSIGTTGRARETTRTGPPPSSQIRPSQRKRPVVLAHPDDVIELSD